MKDLSLHIYDIIQNSIRAEAGEIHVFITENRTANMYTIQIKDDGSGIPAEKLDMVSDAFYTTRTTRKFGLGLPMLKQNTEMTNGHFDVYAEINRGTTITAAFTLDHIDRPHAGDLVSTMGLLITTNPTLNIIYKHITSTGEFQISTNDITKAVGDVHINMPEMIAVIKELIAHNLEMIKAETTGKTLSTTRIF